MKSSKKNHAIYYDKKEKYDVYDFDTQKYKNTISSKEYIDLTTGATYVMDNGDRIYLYKKNDGHHYSKFNDIPRQVSISYRLKELFGLRSPKVLPVGGSSKLNKMTVIELKEIAKKRKIPKYYEMKKQELIDKLS